MNIFVKIASIFLLSMTNVFAMYEAVKHYCLLCALLYWRKNISG